MDHSVSVALPAYLKEHPTLVWFLLMLLIGATILLSHWLTGLPETLLICIGILIKGFLVINYLMGLYDAPPWIRWPMLAYIPVLSALFLVSFTV